MKKLSNAKINIGLKIIGKENGYHLLESEFIPIDIYDEIDITKSNEDEIIGMDLDINDNIIYKTICKIRDRYGINDKYRVVIQKKIPQKAGLGGGSSNAATVIKIINEIYNLNLSIEEMAEVGLSIGSDVPFFIYNKPSKVSGRGEKVTPIASYKEIFGVLVFDNLFFGTKDVYDAFDNLETSSNLINDLECAARTLPSGERIEAIEKDLIKTGAYLSSLTGSGGAVFGLYYSEKETIEAVKMLKDKYSYVKSFKSLS